MADKASVRDKHLLSVMIYVGSQSTGGSDSKESACSVIDRGLIPGSETSSGERNGNSLQ